MTYDSLVLERLGAIDSLRRRLRDVGAIACADEVVERMPSDPIAACRDLFVPLVDEVAPRDAEPDLNAVLGHPVLSGVVMHLADAFTGQRARAIEVIGQHIALAWHWVMHRRSGNQVYEVSPGLASMLRNTELRGLTCDDLRLPFSALAFSVPAAAEIWLLERQVRAPVSEVYAVEEMVPVRYWRLLFVARRADGSSLFERLLFPLPDGESVESSVEVASKRIQVTDNAELFEGWPTQFRWFMNAVLYASSEESREEVWRNRIASQLRARLEKLPPGKKRERLKEQLRSLNPERRIVLGPRVRPGPPSTGPERGQPLVAATRVQGHWKRQACGTERNDRKLIWIQPYWRGWAEGVFLQPQNQRSRVLV